MFKATLSNIDLLKSSVGIISEIIDEGLFKVDSNGISLLTPDRTMVAVVDFTLLSSAFDEYSVEKDSELGLNLANLSSMLKRVKSDDKLTLQLNSKNKLEMVFGKDGKRRFEIPLLDLKSEKPPIEQLQFPGKIDLESSVLESGIEDAGIVSDSIIFEADSKSFKLSAKGDTSSSQLELKDGSEGLLKLDLNESIRARYPLDYLKKMAKTCKLSKQVTLEFGQDYPLRLSFKELDKVNLNFILAPRVEE